MSATEPEPRTHAETIAAELEEAIRRGDYQPGDQLPTQAALSAQYSVARETVRNALDVLKDKRLITVLKGSGSYVRESTTKPIGLRPYLEQAFEADNVTVDFAGFSAETLAGALAEPLAKVRNGHLTPSSLKVRLLVSDMSVPQAIPALSDGSDDERVRRRSERITDRAVHSIAHAVAGLAEGRAQHVTDATAEVRTHRAGHEIKLLILNGTWAFLGFYHPVTRPVTISGEQIEIRDVFGKDSTLLPFDTTDETGRVFIEQAAGWFNAMWDTLGTPYDLV